MFYDSFWIEMAFKEYEYIYGVPVIREIEKIQTVEEEKLRLLIMLEMKNTTNHFGCNYLNPATIAGVIRMLLKKLSTV